MATFSSILNTANLGLRVCPYDSNHKVKETRFAQHLMKCRPRSVSIVPVIDKTKNAFEKTVVVNIVNDMIEKVVSNDDSHALTNDSSDLLDDKCTIGCEMVANDNTCRTENSIADSSDDYDEQWNCCAKDYELFATEQVCDADHEIMQLAEQFADIAVMTRMTKTEKRKMNEKLVEIANAKKDRKLKALEELVMFEEHSNAGDNTFRQPKLSAKQVFKSIPEIQVKRVENNGMENDKQNDTICVVCKQTVTTINSDAITKRMQIYCDKCAGFAKGGYFACQTCKLEGFFAHKEIEEHMKMHFPHINIIHCSQQTDKRILCEKID